MLSFKSLRRKLVSSPKSVHQNVAEYTKLNFCRNKYFLFQDKDQVMFMVDHDDTVESVDLIHIPVE